MPADSEPLLALLAPLGSGSCSGTADAEPHAAIAGRHLPRLVEAIATAVQEDWHKMNSKQKLALQQVFFKACDVANVPRLQAKRWCPQLGRVRGMAGRRPGHSLDDYLVFNYCFE